MDAESGVVTMPAALGTQVLAALRMTMLAGPVLSEPADRWCFLTGKAHVLPKRVAAELAVLGVRLDIETVDTEGAHWVHQPTPDRQLPPWTAVIATVRTVAARNNPLGAAA